MGSKYSKRHFEEIARILRASAMAPVVRAACNTDHATGYEIARNQIALRFEMLFEQDNPRFNLAKFREAAGTSGF